jgi:hypothetical protein
MHSVDPPRSACKTRNTLETEQFLGSRYIFSGVVRINTSDARFRRRLIGIAITAGYEHTCPVSHSLQGPGRLARARESGVPGF